MKTVIITGASKGIGAEIVRYFVEKNFSVVFCARNENEFTRSFGDNARFIKGDLTKRETHERLVKVALDWTGKLDIYVNNVGLSAWKKIEDIDETFLSSMLETNLHSCFWGSQAAAKNMKDGGVIVNISSLAGKRGSANNSAYCAAKFGVNGLTQSLAKELGPIGIRVNAICPVYVRTKNLLSALGEKQSPTSGHSIEEYFENFSHSSSALMRLPTAVEIAKTCSFLASEEASAITGQCINVDCGVLPQ